MPGEIDPTFGRGGPLRLRVSRGWDTPQALAVQSDGKIVVAGDVHSGRSRIRVWVARLTAEGSLDASFGEDESILLGGDAQAPPFETDTDFALARYRPDGTLDPTFGRGGIASTGFGAEREAAVMGIALQGDGRTVTAG